MFPAFITSPALLIAAIAGTGALTGGAIIWARNRPRRLSQASKQTDRIERDQPRANA